MTQTIFPVSVVTYNVPLEWRIILIFWILISSKRKDMIPYELKEYYLYVFFYFWLNSPMLIKKFIIQNIAKWMLKWSVSKKRTPLFIWDILKIITVSKMELFVKNNLPVGNFFHFFHLILLELEIKVCRHPKGESDSVLARLRSCLKIMT